jgi:predicted phage terminase large subunit-like protein
VNDYTKLLDLHAIQSERARRSLKYFARSVWPIVEPAPFVDGWCLDAIVEHLEAVTRGDIRKIVINIPPRHTKSLMLTIWRAWLWTQNPAEQVLGASYSYALSVRDNQRVRRIIESSWFQERFGHLFAMAGDQNVKSFFEDDKRGYQMAISVDGATTGQGGSVLILDDPHNASDAHSEAEREKALIWFREVWTNRLNNQAKDKMVVVGQRVHETDVCGYILRERPDWVHLNLPAEYEPARHCTTSIGWSDPREEEGELLWPERFTHAALDGLKRDLGPNGYSAQYQQSPVPATGGTFQLTWFSHRYTVLPPDLHIYQSIDSAFQEGSNSDWSVIGTWGMSSTYCYKLHVWRGRVAFPQLIKAIRDQAALWHPEGILIENKASGQSAIQVLRQETGLPIISVDPHGSKMFRAESGAPFFEAGRVLLPEEAVWVAEYIEEHVRFPFFSHDDQVDETSQMLTWWRRKDGYGIPIAVSGVTDDAPHVPGTPIEHEDYYITVQDDADSDARHHAAISNFMNRFGLGNGQ